MRKLLLMLPMAALILHTSAKDYAKFYKDLPALMAQVEEVRIPANEVNLNDFGGTGDGVTLNTEAFRKAIEALSEKGGGRLTVTQGIYMTGPITLKDNIEIHLERNAIVMGTEDKTQHVGTLRNGTKDKKAASLIHATGRKNIAITGEGVVNGNGAQWRPVKRGKVSDVEWKEFKLMGGVESADGQLWLPFDLKSSENIAATPEKQESARADLLRVTDCENVLVEGVTFLNSPRFHVHPVRCKNVIIDGVTVRCPWNAQNGDAIDLSNCQRALIVNSTIDVGDDGLCMKGGVGQSGVEQGPCADILIQDNTVLHAHGGFVIGSDVSGGMRNIVVRRCRFMGTDVGLRFKSGIGRGGRTEGIRISDIMMTDIKDQGIIFECTYIDRKAVGFREQDAGRAATPGVPFAPQFQDIRMERVVCHNVKTAVKSIGLEGLACVRDILVKDCAFFYTRQAKDIDSHSDIRFENTSFNTYPIKQQRQ